jgi:hypothetical protein
VKETSPTRSFYNYNIWLNVDFPHIVLICGKRGTGKSYTLGVIAEGLAAPRESKVSTTEEPKKYAILIIDTLGQFWQMKFSPTSEDQEQISSLKKWDLEPRRFQNCNVFVPRGCNKYFQDWKFFSLRVSDLDLNDWCGLLGEDRFSSRIGQLMSQVFEKVTAKGYIWIERDPETGNVVDSRQVAPQKMYGIADLIECLDHDREINSKIFGFESRTIRALRSRLVDVQSWRIFDGEGTPIEDVFKEGGISVLNLQEVDYSLKSLIVGILVKKIFKNRMEARAREEAKKISKSQKKEKGMIPPGWILIDEAHNYCPEEGITAAKDWLIKYAKEGRSLGLGLVATTQQPSSLSNRLSSQIDILISHGLAFSQDINAVEARMLNDPPSNVKLEGESIDTNVLRRLLRGLERGDALISASGANRMFCVRVRPRIALHGGGLTKLG